MLILAPGCSKVDERAPSERHDSSEQELTTSHELSLSLPKGVNLFEVALSSTLQVSIGPNASVLRPGGFGALANAGAGETDIGVSARVGSIASQGHVRLRNRSTVDGDVKTGEPAISIGNAATVTGSVLTGAALTPVRKLTWTISFGSGEQDVVVGSGADRALAPGAYRDVRVQPGATLRLSAGKYDLRTLRSLPNSHVVIDTTAGPVFIYVDGLLDIKEPLDADGAENRVLLGYLGTGVVSLAPPFAGTVVAPRATIKLGSGGYRGSFFAETIEVGPRAEIAVESFAAWDVLFPPVPILDCVARFDATHANALWGYENPLEIAVTIPVGPRNQLVPPEATPITVFEPGRHEGVFWAPFGVPQLSWSLGGETVTASAASRRCAFADLPPTSPTPLDSQGEGSSQPRPSLLPLIASNVFSGVTGAFLPGPVRPPPFAPRRFKFVIDDQTLGSDAICGP
ncbi:MAG: hypothetical protein KF819_07290, partial [Labilithrix sp.]|nr:hypothetical protein [Labilithrix sp.]